MFGGGLVAVLGAESALAVNAATFAASAVLLAMMSSGRIAHASEGIRASIRAGARAIFSDPYLRRAAAISTICSSCAIVGEALVAVYVRENLPAAGDAAIGILAATIPAGTITASLMVRRRGEHAELLRTSALVVVLGSIGGIIWFLIAPPNFWATAAFFSIGITFALGIPAYAVVGSRLPAESRATAFGLLQGMVLGGQAIGSILGGALAILVGAGPAAALALFPALGYAIYAFLVPPGGRIRAKL